MKPPKQTAVDIIEDFEQLGMPRTTAIQSAQVLIIHLMGSVPSEPCPPKSEKPLMDTFKFWFAVQTEINRQLKAANNAKKAS